MTSKIYSLSKAKKLWREWTIALKKGRLPQQKISLLSHKLLTLKEFIDQKQKPTASALIHELKPHFQEMKSKNFALVCLELVFALCFALVFATIVRQMWFEPMEIPTGSMRPTLREQDRLIVSKATYGLNIPLTPGHFYFDPTLLKRGEIFVFTVEGIKVHDPKTVYFGLFPGYKRFVKRCLGKPGDLLYFYGGEVLGIDGEGKPIPPLSVIDPKLKNIDTVPFISYEGAPSYIPQKQEVDFYQTGQLLAKITVNDRGQSTGSLWSKDHWIQDHPAEAMHLHDHIVTYSDIWGMGNYAMVRLVKPEDVSTFDPLPAAPLYLELRHHPRLNLVPAMVGSTKGGQNGAHLATYISYFPLNETHVEALWKQLYTSRFFVRGGYGLFYKGGEGLFYNQSHGVKTSHSPLLPQVPDGCYEFYNGIAYRIGFGGTLLTLPSSHPLNQKTLDNLYLFFNTGMELNTLFLPNKQSGSLPPARYAYFRNGSLYVMGGIMAQAGDESLQQFVENEEMRLSKATAARPYLPFIDNPPPMKDGLIDPEFLKAFGFKLPEGQYLALGDNYAMSGDSRLFGLIPQENIEGRPWFLLWPFGKRFGFPLQPTLPWVTLPHIVILILVAISYSLWRLWQKKKDEALVNFLKQNKLQLET